MSLAVLQTFNILLSTIGKKKKRFNWFLIMIAGSISDEVIGFWPWDRLSL
jgi:hypothetical protein